VQPGSIVGELIQTSGTINTNTPRFDYDPTTLQPRGLLIEGSANNIQPYSTDLSQTGTWAQQGLVGVTANVSGIVDPANGTSASKIRSSSASSTSHLVYSTLATVSGTAYTMSAWVRAAEYNFAALHFASGANRYTVVFNLTTGAVTQTTPYGSPTGTGSNAVKFGDWWRLSLTMNAADTTSYPHICLSSTATPSVNAFGQPAFTGTSESGVYVWGAQLETGSGASSYIPTGASQGSRAADSCVMTGTNFSSWYQSATAGTVYCEFDNPRANLGVAQTPAPANLGNYSAGNLLSGYLGGYPVGQGFAAAVWGNGGTDFQSATVATAVSVALGNKGAFAFTGQSIVGAFRGFSSATATTTGTVNAKTVLYVGANGTGGTSTRDFLNSCIQRIKFFPTQYTAAQLQALTT
jgi:hypothetical protein